jgi:diacylglycerol kinase family enzyme
MKVLHLLNPSRRRYERVASLVEAGGLSSPWAWVAKEHPDHTETLVEWCLREKVGRLVVWGGDGTFHRVVRALWQRKAISKLDLCLVPAGTCNDLARRLGFSFEQWEQWDRPMPEGKRLSLAVGHLKSTDGKGIPSEDVFINNAGFGRPKDSFDRRDPPWRTLASFRPLSVTARWSAGEIRGLYYMGLFCLGPYFSGGLHFESDPSPVDGVLRTYLVPARSKPRLAARLILGRLGRPLADHKITKITTPSLRMSVDSPVWPQVDGEPPPSEGARHLEVAVLPDRLNLWSPA